MVDWKWRRLQERPRSSTNGGKMLEVSEILLRRQGRVDFWRGWLVSLCSPNLLFKFIDYLQDECKLGHGGRLGYIDTISEMIDSASENFMASQRQFLKSFLRQSCTSKERERQLRKWWDCSGHKISTLRHLKQEATGQQWRSCLMSWNFICRATKIPWQFANRVYFKLTLQT